MSQNISITVTVKGVAMPESDIVPNSITNIDTFDEEFPLMAEIIFPHHKEGKLDPEMSSGDLETAAADTFTQSFKNANRSLSEFAREVMKDSKENGPIPVGVKQIEMPIGEDGKFKASKTVKYKIKGIAHISKGTTLRLDDSMICEPLVIPNTSNPKDGQILTAEGYMDAVVMEVPPMDRKFMDQGYVAISKTKGKKNLFDIMTISTLTTSDDDTPMHIKGTVMEEDENYYYLLENKPTQLYSFKTFKEAFIYMVKRESGYIRKLDTMLSSKFNFEYVDGNCHEFHDCNTDALMHRIYTIDYFKKLQNKVRKYLWLETLCRYHYDILHIRKNVEIDEKTNESTDIYEFFAYPLKENKHV